MEETSESINEALRKFQEWIKPRLGCIPPIELRDFDHDPRFTREESAIQIWRKEHQKTCTLCQHKEDLAIERAIDADIDSSEHPEDFSPESGDQYSVK